MTHTTRVERHILVDIASGVCGALFVGSLLQKSWWEAVLATLLAIALLFWEKGTIREEEMPVKPTGRVLANTTIQMLAKMSVKNLHDQITPEQHEVYVSGLEDGTATLAQYILDATEEPE
jgi:hypothetical protein